MPKSLSQVSNTGDPELVDVPEAPRLLSQAAVRKAAAFTPGEQRRIDIENSRDREEFRSAVTSQKNPAKRAQLERAYADVHGPMGSQTMVAAAGTTDVPVEEAPAPAKNPTWKEISESPKFKALDDQGKEDVRLDYWQNYVSPQIDTADLDRARAEFDELTKPGILKRLGNAAKDMLSPSTPDYGKRSDGTPKGSGYFGELKRPDGDVSTELSIGVNIDGKEREIPSLVPSLTRAEVDHLLNGGAPTEAIVRKAVAHARERLAAGKDPFAGAGEQGALPGEALASPARMTMSKAGQPRIGGERPERPGEGTEGPTWGDVAEGTRSMFISKADAVEKNLSKMERTASGPIRNLTDGSPYKDDAGRAKAADPEYVAMVTEHFKAADPQERSRMQRGGALSASIARAIAPGIQKEESEAARDQAAITGKRAAASQSDFDFEAAHEEPTSARAIGRFLAENAPAAVDVKRQYGNYESGLVGSTGASLAYAGRKMGAPGLERIGDSMVSWAQGRGAEKRVFADKLMNAVGSMASFYVPGIGLAKGTTALATLSPALAKWTGAGAMAGLEAAAEADSVYRTLIAQGKSTEEASSAADKTFLANLALLGVTDKVAFFNDLKGLGKKIAVAAATEGPGQEGPQQVIQNYFTGAPLMQDVAENALIGAAVGGGAAAVRGALEREPTQAPAPRPREEPTLGAGAAAPVEQPGRAEPTMEAGPTLEDQPGAEAIDAAAVRGEEESAGPASGVPVGEPATEERPAAAPVSAAAGETQPTTAPAEKQGIEGAAEGLKGIFESPVDEAAHEAATSPHNDRDEPTPAQKDAGNYAMGHTEVAGHDISVENPEGSHRYSYDVDRIQEVIDKLQGLKESVDAQTAAYTLERALQHIKDGQPAEGRAALVQAAWELTQQHGRLRDVVDEILTRGWHTKMQDHYGYIRGTVAHDSTKKKWQGLDAFVKPGTPQDWKGTVFVVNQNHDTGKLDEHKSMIGYGSADEAREAYLRNYDDREKAEKRIRSIVPMPLRDFRRWAYDKENGPKAGVLDPDRARAEQIASIEQDIDQGKGDADLIPDMNMPAFERMLEAKGWKRYKKGKGEFFGKLGVGDFGGSLFLRSQGESTAPIVQWSPMSSEDREAFEGSASSAPSTPKPEKKAKEKSDAVREQGADAGSVRGAPGPRDAGQGEGVGGGDAEHQGPSGARPSVEEGAAAAEEQGAKDALSSEEVAKLADAFAKKLRKVGYKTILEARAAAAAIIGRPVQPGTPIAKGVDEAIELGVVLAARGILQEMRSRGATDVEIYGALRELYERQPNLNVRTSTSIANQAYSTPVPLAFIASRLAGITWDTPSIYEPTAGNGALLIDANPKNVAANELNDERRRALASMGFRTSGSDASNYSGEQARRSLNEGKPFDVVIGNPPFGYTKDEKGATREWKINAQYTTNQIDHAISMKALEAMKDDGRAVLIVGAPKEGKKDGYDAAAKRSFYFTLYRDYNVVDHFTVAGDLYAKQGAAWPVDVIVIHGRGKSALRLPQAVQPRQYDSWDALKEKLNGLRTVDRGTDSQPGAGTAPEGAAGQAGAAASVGGGGVQPVRAPGRGAGGQPAGDGHPVRSGSDRGQSSADRLDAGKNDQPGKRPGAGDVRGADRPADAGAGGQLDAGKLFDEEFSKLFGDIEQAPKRGATDTPSEREAPGAASGETAVPRPADLAKSAAKETGAGLADVAKGLNALFDSKGKLGSGPTFDEETYAKAKPFFISGVQHFKQAATDIRELVRLLLTELRTKFNMTAEAIHRMKPYIVRFIEDVQNGVIDLVGGQKKSVPAKRPGKFQRGDRVIGRDSLRKLEVEGEIIRTPIDEPVYVVKGDDGKEYGFLPEQLAHATRAPEQPAATPRVERPKEQETEHQANYTPSSSANPIGTLVPVNMKGSIADSLEALEERVGSLDDYVAKELAYPASKIPSYFSAEQVDALALALDAMKSDAGFIIGDQTGIGKGRVNAGIIRWAIKNGKTPIFVTEKPNLYGDIMRDLADIDSANVKPIMTNSNAEVPLDDEAALYYAEHEAEVEAAKAAGQKPPRMPSIENRPGKWLKTTAKQPKILDEILAKGSLGDYGVIFTTYNQMQSVAGNYGPRHRFLETFANGSVVIFDESHNAGGTGEDPDAQERKSKNESPKRSDFARGLLASAASVFYSSATYAKRPQVMDLYFRTDMGKTMDAKALVRAIKDGGVPLQQVVAAMLAKAGQYIRREKSFAGITYDTAVVKVNRQVAERISATMKSITEFDKLKGAAVTAADADIKDSAGSVREDGSIGAAGAHSTNFTSLMHNVVNQMLLALKVAEIGDAVLESLKKGEKPVLTVANTMGSFIEDYVKDHHVNPGDAIGISFRDMMLRYLERSRDIVEGDAFGKKTRRRMSDEELGPAATQLWNEIKKSIEEADVLNDIPLSPIDYIKHRLEAEGYKFGEITGRSHALDYSGAQPIYRRRPGSATSIGGRKATIAQFNNGTLDVLLINQAGATGLSLHSSEKFKDQRRRHMVIIQAEGNIDVHMQVLGRINRTGQVTKDGTAPKGKPAVFGLPVYTQLVADVPAEKRPAAVLAKKMASLNANTTASRGSAVTAKNVVDFMNEYGDEVAAQLMEDYPEIHAAMDEPLHHDDKGSGLKAEDAVRKVTGRIPLLPLQQQEELYDLLESEYQALIEEKDRLGENALEAKTLPLDAKVKKVVTVTEDAAGARKSPFYEGAKAEIVDVKKLGKAYTSAELLGILRKELEVDYDAELPELVAIGQKRMTGTREMLEEDFKAYKQAALDELDDKHRGPTEIRLQAAYDRLDAVLARANEGRAVLLKTRFGDLPAVVTKVDRKGNPKNPAALGAWKVTFAVADAIRHITIPGTRLFAVGTAPTTSIEAGAVEIDDYRTAEHGKRILQQFDEAQSQSREDRVIITGNLLAGYGKFRNGRIINYTTDAGDVRQGILMPSRFDLDKSLNAMPVEFPDAESAVDFIDKMGVYASLESVEEKVFIFGKQKDGTGYRFAVAGAKNVGGAIYLNPDVLKAAGRDFVKAGANMRLDVVTHGTAVNVLRAIMALGYHVHANQYRQQAKDFLKKRAAAAPPTTSFSDSGMSPARTSTKTAAFKEWFGQSVVTTNGRRGGPPRVVYHGSRRDFSEFADDGSFTGFFALNPKLAQAYTESDNGPRVSDAASNGGVIYPAFLSIQNPAYLEGFDLNSTFDRDWFIENLDVPENVIDEAIDAAKSAGRYIGYPKNWVVVHSAPFREWLESNGYDGIWAKEGGNVVWAVMRPDQIKSATGNRGAFDPSNPDITFASGWDTVDSSSDGAQTPPPYPRRPRANAELKSVLDRVAADARSRKAESEGLDWVLQPVWPKEPGELARDKHHELADRGRDFFVAERVAQHFGHTAVFFENTGRDELSFGGFVTGHAPGKIFINIDARRPALFVVGHELFHAMEREAPDVYARFVSAVEGMIQNAGEYRHSLAAPGRMKHEILADFTGWNFTKPEFWSALRVRERGLFGRIADFALTFFNRLVGAFRGTTPAMDRFVSDVHKARAALVDAFEEWQRGPLTDTTRDSLDFVSTGTPRENLARDMSITDKVLSAPFKLARWDQLADRAWSKISALNDRVTDASETYETIRAGVESNFGLEEPYVDRRVEMQVNLQKWARGAKTMLDQLGSLTRDEARVAYEWMNERDADHLMDSLPAESRDTLRGIKELIRQLGEEAVALGQLSREVFERNELAYLHRSYFRYELEQTLASRLGNRKAIALWAEQYKQRGIKDWRTHAELLAWAKQAGVQDLNAMEMKGKKFRRLELRARPRQSTAEQLHGREGLGRLRKVVYIPADAAIPNEYANWLDDGEWEVRWLHGGKWGLWRDLTRDERMALGEIDEVRFAVAKTLHLMTHDIEVGRTQRWIAQNYAKDRLDPGDRELTASESLGAAFGRSAWVKVPDSKVKGTNTLKYGALAGKYVSGPVWNDIRQHVSLDQGKGKVRKLWDDALRMWKVSKTSLSPGVHTNNVMANFFIADFHDLRAKDLVKALRVMLDVKFSRAPGQDNADLYRHFEDSGALHGLFKYHELRKEALEPILDQIRDEALNDEQTAMARVLSVVSWLNALERGAKAVPGKMIAAYSAEDEVFRLAMFIKARRAGLSDLEAGKLARQAFLDYDINAPWIQALRNTAFPFIAFPYRALPMMVDTFTRKPWKLVKYVGVAALLDSLAYAMLGLGDDDERRERALLAEEKQGRIWGLFPKMIRMPWNNESVRKNGTKTEDPVFLDVRRWYPGGDVFDVDQTHAAIPWSPTTLPGGPVALLAELFSNRSSFTGQPITLETDTAWEMSKKVGLHLYRFAAPNLFMIPGTWSFEGLKGAMGFGEAGEQTDVFGRAMDVPQAFGSAMGVKLGSYPEDVGRYNLVRRSDAQVREILGNIYKAQGERARNKITDQELRDYTREQLEKVRKIQQETQDRVRPAAPAQQ